MPTTIDAAVRLRAAADLTRGIVSQRVSTIRRTERRQQSAYYRRLWDDTAAALGATIRPVEDGYLEIGLGPLTTRIRNTHCTIDGREVLARAGDKVLVHRLLGAEGLAAPEHETFTLGTFDRAMRFLAAAPGDCVVKPGQDSSAGSGVTTLVRTQRDLVRAAAEAAQVGARSSRVARTAGRVRRITATFGQLTDVSLLIERQVEGGNYRLLFLDGELVDAIRRGVPSVVGDGESTVEQLLESLNAARIRFGGVIGQSLVKYDLDSERTLADQGLTASSVPEPARIVRIKTTINASAADTNAPARDELCEAIVTEAARAAALVGVRWAGVDVLTSDPAVSLAESGGRVLEVNTTPGLAMHYHGKPGEVDVARELLMRLAAKAGHSAAEQAELAVDEGGR
jgi:cyanophycin synthetase